jgi:MSHA biogenesis protein MshJ
MNERWKTLAARIDALSLRERAFLFLSLVAVCVALADLAWLSPARLAHQRALQEFTTNNTELQRLRTAVREKPDTPSPVRDLQDRIAKARAQVDAVNRDIATVNGPTRSPPRLQDLLSQFLRKHPSLHLVQTANLAPEASAQGAPTPSGTTAARPSGAVLRQGMAVTLAGPYADLVRFTQGLETSLPELRWGTMRLSAAGQPPELTLQVYLVTPQP